MTAIGSRRLTPFQSLMREWSELAPYNGIHAMQLPRPADIARWRKAVDLAGQSLGFGQEAIPLEQPAADLEAHLNAELHRPFSSLDQPLRFFVISPKDNGHWLGVVFDHWLADDFSARQLLQMMYSTYVGHNGDSWDFGRARLERRTRGPGSWRAWPGFLKQMVALRRARRTSFRAPMDFRVHTFRKTCPEGSLESILQLAKRNDATFNDAFLAATLQTFGVRGRETGTKRDAVAIASAMDLRRFEPESERNCFGLSVGHYILIEKSPDEVSLEELTRRIAVQTRRMKVKPGADVLVPILLFWRLSRSPNSKATFFLRGAPLAAGLSNVNLTGSWIESSEITDYRRIGPAGPLVPMVLVITTLRGRVLIDVTFRTTAFSLAEAAHLIDDVIQRLSGNQFTT